MRDANVEKDGAYEAMLLVVYALADETFRQLHEFEHEDVFRIQYSSRFQVDLSASSQKVQINLMLAMDGLTLHPLRTTNPVTNLAGIQVPDLTAFCVPGTWLRVVEICLDLVFRDHGLTFPVPYVRL